MTALDIAARINAEETLMLQQFGDEYRIYMQKTGRILPRFRYDNN
jgi:protein-S-isoprenylcysteine O-methyltransferase Ste14